MKSLRVFFMVLVVIAHCVTILQSGSASAFEDVQIVAEIDLPNGLNFSTGNICTDHLFFMQASANEAGQFATYSRHVDSNNYKDVDFDKVYIDIYTSDGKFYQELTFNTPLDFAFDLTADSINFYFYASVLTYDMNTQELHHYSIPDGAAVNSGLYNELRQDEFVCGNWKYTCVKAFDGYTKLERSNDSVTQVLVHMPGLRNNFWNVFFPGLAIGIIGLAIVLWFYKRAKNKTVDRFTKTGDDSVS